jgi:hypothetical protein
MSATPTLKSRFDKALAQLPQHFEKIRRAGIFLDLFWT